MSYYCYTVTTCCAYVVSILTFNASVKLQYAHTLNTVLMMCGEQADTSHSTENSTPAVYYDQLSSSVTTCGQLGQLSVSSQYVEPKSAGSSAFGDTTGYPAVMSDGGNSRDSWSSTSSNAVLCQRAPTDQQWMTYHSPSQQPSQYSRNMHQQQYHVYEWAHRHTWVQLESNQSRCHQTYPQHVQQPQCLRYHCVNPRPQSDETAQHQYLRSTSPLHPYHHYLTHASAPCLPSSYSPRTTREISGVQQVHAMQYSLPAQTIHHQPGTEHGMPPSVHALPGGRPTARQQGMPHSVHPSVDALQCNRSAQPTIHQQDTEHIMPCSAWISTEDQCGTTSSALPTTYNSSAQTLAPCYQVDNCVGMSTLAEPGQQQQQQQHAGLLTDNSSNVFLSNDHSFPWSPDVSYDNNFNDW